MTAAVTELNLATAQQPAQLPEIRKHLAYKEMREVAEELESVFLNEMLKPMFEGIEASAPFGGGQGESIYRDMQVSEYSKALTQRGGIGIADAVMDQLIRLQEAA